MLATVLKTKAAQMRRACPMKVKDITAIGGAGVSVSSGAELKKNALER